MYVKRNISWGIIIRYAWKNLLFFTIYGSAIFCAYYFLGWTHISIPFQPLSVIGIAVAFYIGFKNSQSYDRFWEGRKIWGGIVNYSRTWANNVLSFVDDTPETKRILIYRHIAWINALRIQLRQPSSFSIKENRSVEKLFDRHGERNPVCAGLDSFLSPEEDEDLENRKNIATHLIKNQGQHLKQLLKDGKITEFDKQVFHSNLEEMYNLQGKCERIKNTPFPRQYAYFSTLFTWIFVLLLPFGLLSVFKTQLSEIIETTQWWLLPLMIFFSVLISWIFTTMEKVGSNSEDPFEGRINDVPMTALCKTIEIDLRDMLDEDNLPEKVKAQDNILY
ncbi:bestrophin family protein [Maribacter sp. 2308TA10-17]|uniref:bestrophin family protein n=1 Tax=Maribacter sp. 2308TA10-17 TaxID=3386276 RepID=UPI0039BCCC8F